jgi:HK97 gp10 family phage protein
MPDEVKFTLIGLEALEEKFKAITYDVKRKGGRAALRKAARVIMEAAKNGAGRLDDPETGRSIAANMAIRWNGKLFKRSGDLGFRIGVLHGALLRKPGETIDLSANAPTPHWRLLEFGTEKMRAQPFMRPALENNVANATSTFLREYEKAIDRAIKRAAKK